MNCRLPSHLVRCSALSIAAFALLGCSAHPLPGDFSRKSTFDIVERIRCEGAEALREIPSSNPFLKKAFIGYDFNFGIIEENNAGDEDNKGQLFFERLLSSGSFTLDLQGYATRKRDATRTFRIVESLEQLKTANCSPGTKRENLLYPITGSIGMKEIVQTYIGIERLTTFRKVRTDGRDPPPWTQLDPKDDKSPPVVFSDILVFTTTLGGSAKPELELNAVGVGSLKLKTGQIFAEATRMDTHSLTVVLSRDPTDTTEPPDEDEMEGLVNQRDTEGQWRGSGQ
jgi:hypothetical protein